MTTQPTQEPTKLVCKICGKVIQSFSPAQAKQNLAVHRLTHEKK